MACPPKRAKPSSIDCLELITRILLEVAISIQLTYRNWEDIEVRVEVLTCFSITLPRPIVVVVTTIASEADKCRTADTLEIELTCPLVTDIIERI